MDLYKSPNLNLLWSHLLVEELTRLNINYFCLAPGSRSTPLVVAVSQNPKVESFIHLDERALAFHALGYASATKKPAVLICTSGTAVANFFPAIVEASKKKIPLIVLTADRPPELRKTGANQTIEQSHIFGEYVRWQVDLPCPDPQIPPEFVLTTIDQAVYRAQGELPGPVHLNCPFREPLAPLAVKQKPLSDFKNLAAWLKSPRPYTLYHKPQKIMPKEVLKAAAEDLNKIKNGIIVAGKLAGEEDQQSVIRLSQILGWPVFPDISSGLRIGEDQKSVIPYYDQLLLSPALIQKIEFDGVLHCGGRITSQRWYDLINHKKPAEYWMILNHPLRNDPLHNVTRRFECPVNVFAEGVIPFLKQRRSSRILTILKKANAIVHQELSKAEEGLDEPETAKLISKLIPTGTGLFLASSMPVREMDMFALKGFNTPHIGSNRGASGIDGTMASACGFARGLKKPVTLLIGDLAFLYDLNALLMFKETRTPVIAVVLNNNGGAIFSFLPIAEYPAVFEKYFGTPHGLSFAHAARLFGLNYANPGSAAEFTENYQKALHDSRSTIIEVNTDRTKNLQRHRAIQYHLRKKIEQGAYGRNKRN